MIGGAMSKKKRKSADTEYAHNPNYCMIMPDAEERDDDSIVPSNQS